MADVDFYLKIDGIDGESQDSKHKNEIEIMSWSFGASQQGTFSAGGGGGAGKVHMDDFQFSMPTQKASPKLMLACASGEHIKKAVLTVRKAGKEQQEYLKYTFSDILVSSYHTNGHSAVPNDSITLNFSKIETEYKEQNADGTLKGPVTTGWDVKQNKKV